MDYTSNYNLKKPTAEDFYNINDFNENADIIDTKLKELEDNKFDKADYTADDVLDKLKTVDGSDSGLDADLLDGKHASEFATAEQGTKADNALPASSYTASDVLNKLKTVDGSGSELDADTVDGKHANEFLVRIQSKMNQFKVYKVFEYDAQFTNGYTYGSISFLINESNVGQWGIGWWFIHFGAHQNGQYNFTARLLGGTNQAAARTHFKLYKNGLVYTLYAITGAYYDLQNIYILNSIGGFTPSELTFTYVSDSWTEPTEGTKIFDTEISVTNTIFGDNAAASSTNTTNEIVIGAGASGKGSNTAHIGNSSVTSISYGPGTGTMFTNRSDRRLKEDIQEADLSICYDAVKKLQLRRFRYKDFVGNERDIHITGFIADEFEKVFPKAVIKKDQKFPILDENGDPVVDEDGKPKMEEIKDCASIDMSQVVPTLLGAVQKLMEKVETLEAEIAALKT